MRGGGDPEGEPYGLDTSVFLVVSVLTSLLPSPSALCLTFLLRVVFLPLVSCVSVFTAFSSPEPFAFPTSVFLTVSVLTSSLPLASALCFTFLVRVVVLPSI